MFISLNPKYGVNYDKGYIFFTGDDNSFVHKGITWLSYKDLNSIYTINQSLKFSHVGICIGGNQGIHSTFQKGVHYVNLEKYFNDTNCRIVFRKPRHLAFSSCQKFIRRAESMVGERYDYSLFFGFALMNSWIARTLLTSSFRNSFIEKFDSEKGMICSEFVMKCARNVLTLDNKTTYTPAEVFFHKFLEKIKTEMSCKIKSTII